MRVTYELTLTAFCSVLTACVSTGSASNDSRTKRCQPFTVATLQDLERQPKPTTVVFFSSWCVSCRDAMIRPRDGQAILVGAFDETANLERVYISSGATLPCYIDDGIATARFGVKSLPFETTFDKTLRL